MGAGEKVGEKEVNRQVGSPLPSLLALPALFGGIGALERWGKNSNAPTKRAFLPVLREGSELLPMCTRKILRREIPTRAHRTWIACARRAPD